MARSTVVHNQISKIVNFDDTRRKGDVFQSLLMVQLVDELTGDPIDRPISISHDVRHGTPKSATFGICGVVGVPRKCFPNLAVAPYTVNARFEVTGYEPVNVTHTFLADGTYPDSFADANLGQVGLRRAPVVLSGRTVELDAQNRPVPVPSADVAISGIWRLVADIDLAAGPDTAARFLSLSPSLYADRATADVTIVTLTPAGAPTRLTSSATPGDTFVNVLSTAGIVVGNVVRIGTSDPDLMENMVVAQVISRNDPASPGQLRFSYPVQRKHYSGEDVDVVAVMGAGPDATATEAARAEDSILFVNTTSPFTGAAFVQVLTPAMDNEYLTAAPIVAVSDAEGFYRLPCISRIAAFEVSASAGALTATANFTPNYGLFSNGLDLTMS